MKVMTQSEAFENVMHGYEKRLCVPGNGISWTSLQMFWTCGLEMAGM